MRLTCVESRLYIPIRREEVVVVVAQLVTVLDDAANLNVRQSEDLGHLLEALGLLDQLLEGLAGEWDDSAIGMDGSACNLTYGISAVFCGVVLCELDVGHLLTAVGEHLEADIDAPHMEFVVRDLLFEKVDGGCAGDLWLGGHFEFLGGGDGPLGMGGKRDTADERKAADDGAVNYAVHDSRSLERL